jgi:transcription factor C subunit 8
MAIVDAVIQRAELSSLYDSLKWSPDGTIAVNTSGSLTLLKPKHVKGDVKTNSKNILNDLFEVEKLDLDSLPRNNLYLNEPDDERVSTLFSTTDIAITKFEWSPLSASYDSFLAVLTNRLSLLILRNGRVVQDLTSDIIVETQDELDEFLFSTFEWARSDGGDLILHTGLKSGHIRSYRCLEREFEEFSFVKVSEYSIVSVRSVGSQLIAVSSENEIFLVKDEGSVSKIKEADRFKIDDVFVSSSKHEIYFSTFNKLSKIKLSDGSLTTLKIGIFSTSKILQSGVNELLVVSETNTAKINIEAFQQINDNVVEPLLQSRLNKWNAIFNDFNTKLYKIKVFGVDLNYNGNILAVLYEIQNVNGFRYKISSENTFKISFIPLDNNNLENEASSLAIFQSFKLTGRFQEPKQLERQELDFSLELDNFLESAVLQNPVLRSASITNLIVGGQDEKIRKLFAELIVKYVKANNLSFDNDIDKVVYNNLLLISNDNPLDNVPDEVTFKADSFTQTFNFNDNSDIESLHSKDGLVWTRCSLTFLPILTPNIKYDPVTERRIINFEKDELNEYGEFTKSILKLNSVSLYSGSNYVSK